MIAKQKISLVLADANGSLVDEEKVLTKRAQSAVMHLRRAGSRFAITSDRSSANACSLGPMPGVAETSLAATFLLAPH
jgi:hypothetical protein